MRHSLAHDVSLRVYEQGVGDGANIVDLRGLTVPPFQVGHLLPRQAKGFDGLLPRLLVVVERHADYFQSLVLVLVVKLYQLRH